MKSIIKQYFLQFRHKFSPIIFEKVNKKSDKSTIYESNKFEVDVNASIN